MTSQLSFLDRLVEDLLKSKRNNYSEQCLNFYVDDDLFSIDDVQKLYNSRQERLKCSLIRHKHSEKRRLGMNANSKCILYLHGFGSSRLEALSLIEFLPVEYCLCIFDLSGSGKSEGSRITYGIKEAEDIDPVINYLAQKKWIDEFVIWGRSMGAVAALLYAKALPNRLHTHNRKPQRRVPLVTQSLKSSFIALQEHSDKQPITPNITSLVLDSPFFSFREIAKEIAQKNFLVPSLLLNLALSSVEDSFSKILSSELGPEYNPFKISFEQRIKLGIPAIFIYSENDEIIAPSHSERLMKNMDSKYEKIIITPCTHNQARPSQAITEVFRVLQRLTKAKNNFTEKHSQEISRESIINASSSDKKRGIFIYTPSKDAKKQPSPAKCYQKVSIQLINTEEYCPREPKTRSNSRKSIITLQAGRAQRKSRKEGDLASAESQQLSQINTMDSDMGIVLSKKLVSGQSISRGLKMTRTSKRFAIDKTKQFMFSNQQPFI